jgi:hypothetical protein
MLSVNETLLLLPNQSFPIENKQLSCVSNIKIQLIVHFFLTRIVEALLLYFLVSLYFIMILFFYHYWSRITDVIDSYWLDISDLDTCSSTIIVLKAEMKLLFVYVYMAFLYTWIGVVNSNYTVTYLNFLCWLIEASVVPEALIISLFFNFLSLEIDFCHEYHGLYVSMLIIKLPLFILMRYAESQSDFFINAYPPYLFKILCYQPSQSNIH